MAALIVLYIFITETKYYTDIRILDSRYMMVFAGNNINK